MNERRGLYERTGDLVPGTELGLLLTAGLADTDAGIAAWEHWKLDFGSLDDLPSAWLGLLPRLAVNLEARLGDGPSEQRLRGVSKHTWTQNRLTEHRVAPVLDQFERRELRVMALGDAAGALSSSDGLAARRIGAVDLLVDAARLDDAVELVRTAGFQPDGTPQPVGAPRPAEGGVRFRADGVAIGLHLDPIGLPGRRDLVWEHARSADLGGAPISIPAAEHTVVHACVAVAVGVSRPNDPLWIADSAAALREDPDWTRLAAYARAQRVRFPSACALAVIDTCAPIELPPGLVAQLRAPSADARERLAHRLVAGPPRIPRLHWYAHLYWNLYRPTALTAGERVTASGFFAFLAALHELDSPARLPAYELRWLGRRIAERGGLRNRSLTRPPASS